MIKLLDHGYIKLVDKMGTDASIIEAARMSTDKGFLGWGPLEDMEDCKHCGGTSIVKGTVRSKPYEAQCIWCVHGKVHKPGDEKLLEYLYNNKHSTPFEFCQLVVEVKAPIAVIREWERHRTQGYNEMSARYVPLPNENYIPSVERLILNSKTNKQAGTIKGAEELTLESAAIAQRIMRAGYERDENDYQTLLTMGVPKELARMHLPVGRYSKMRATANLRNWLGFLTLRMAPNAQWEIRQYANAVGTIIAEHYPRTWELFIPSQVAATSRALPKTRNVTSHNQTGGITVGEIKL